MLPADRPLSILSQRLKFWAVAACTALTCKGEIYYLTLVDNLVIHRIHVSQELSIELGIESLFNSPYSDISKFL
jgi:hypothetical protein